ncbi:hypothetical protein AcW1_006619 [Taiwanofungus camphoratus]|nr:hypothetical protein AcV7_007450 [Antrodia cinnamomea]KAI0954848.1 hypothetical protein AcW1_006619 [Antrodia cinnamomea]
MNTLFFVIIASLCGLSHALRLPVVSRSVPKGPGVHSMKLVGIQSDDNVIDFQDTVYATNMTLGGQEFLIQLDTGSSDLWVQLPQGSGQIELTNITNITATNTYGIGAVAGPIAFANASLGPHFVPNQAFINATNATDFGTIFGDNVRGILGLAFDQASIVDLEILINLGVNETIGRTFVSNVFAQNDSTPNLFTILLGRSGDPAYTTEGLFTIGEYDPDFSAVASQPRLPRFPNYKNISTPPRWSVVMDRMTVNGQAFQFNTSGVPGVPEGSVVAVLDTGFTFPPIPAAAVDFVYGSIDGATFDNSSNLWIVPCENSTTLEFQFGDVSVPIHPLDITTVTQLNNKTVCVNTFRPTTFPVNDQFDIILGDAFLKNVYASFNYGNWTPQNETAIPFIQLLPTTNITAAFDEFAQVRSSAVAVQNGSSISATASALPTTVSASMSVVPSIPTPSGAFSSLWSSAIPAPSVATAMNDAASSDSCSSPAPSASATTWSRRSYVEPSRSVADRLVPFAERYGPLLVALLGGCLVMSFALCIVSVALYMRACSRLRSQHIAPYSVDAAKAGTEDLEADCYFTNYHDDY